jgi:FAD/FMN-containing dehydrogenase
VGSDLSRRQFLAGSVAAGLAAWTMLGRIPAGSAESTCPPPPGFPGGIDLYQSVYENWARAIHVDDVWTCAPRTPAEVATLATWAAANGWRLRPRGFMHNWSPLTLTGGECAPRYVLVDTTQHLTSMAMTTDNGVRVGAGASMEALLGFLERRGRGINGVPAPGDVTVGGVLAIDGHGASLPGPGESGAFGSISNLVRSLTAIVWRGNRYEPATFARGDDDAPALMTHLGRAFVTDAVLETAPLAMLRCQSFTDITAAELFAPAGGQRSFASFIAQSGRAEAIWFPFTDSPWFKVWTVAPTKPLTAREVTSPYNYPFSDNIPPELAALADSLVKGNGASTPAFGEMSYAVSVAGLAATQSSDIWGAAKNTQLYIKPTTLRATANGYAVHCRRADIQRVTADFVAKYVALRDAYRARDEYPMNMPVEIRASGTDAMDGPLLSAVRPIRPEWDAVVWFDVLSFPGTPAAERFYAEMEAWLIGRFGDALRPEWSKGWGYSDTSAWADVSVAQSRYPEWDRARRTFDRLDPHRVFSNDFLDRLI